MEIFLIAFVSFCASLLTFFTGFGLGTILTPLLLFFFPVFFAIFFTAILHLFHNLVKLFLFLSFVQWKIAILFGLPAILSAAIGSFFLFFLSDIPSSSFWILSFSPLKIVIGLLLILLGLLPFFSLPPFSQKHLLLGGFLSGFFGGLSGLQGAFRTPFLLKVCDNKKSFIATSCFVSFLIDITRVLFYLYFHPKFYVSSSTLLLISLAATTLGVFAGKYLLQTMTYIFLQKMVTALLLIVGFLLIFGII